jgi:hypothetical protein
MRIVRRVLLLTVTGLVMAAVLVMTAAGGERPFVSRASTSWVQPPATVPISTPTPGLPAVVGAAHL